MKNLLTIINVAFVILLLSVASADQTITGGSAPGKSLILRSTTNATKGYIGIDSSIIPAIQMGSTGIKTHAVLDIGTTPTNVSNGSFVYRINGTEYSKSPNEIGTAPGDDVVPLGKYGAVALDIGADGTIDVVEATDNATGYDSAAPAVAGLPAAASDHVRMGYVTVYPFGIVTPTVMSIGSAVTAVANTEFTYILGGATYTQAANTAGSGVPSGNIPMGRYGAVAFDLDNSGTIWARAAVNNGDGYDSSALAIAGLPTTPFGYVRMGTVTAIKNSTPLSTGSTTTNVANAETVFYVSNNQYTLPANAAGTAPGNDVIPSGKYGAVALDVGADLAIDVIEAASNALGYTTAAQAIAGLPTPAIGHVRIGTVTATKSDGAFTFGTTALNAANTTVAYASAFALGATPLNDSRSTVAFNSTSPASAFTFGTTFLNDSLVNVTYTSTPGMDTTELIPDASGWKTWTQPQGDASGKLATTAYVDAAVAGKIDSVDHTANCVMGYDGNDEFGCWNSWAKADTGNIILDGPLSIDGDVTINSGTKQFQYRSGGTTYSAVRRGVDTRTEEIVVIIDGNGSAISTGVKADRLVNHAMTITSVSMLADQSGSAVVDIWKDTYANYPATDADTITSSMPPTITAGIKSQDSTLTGWTKTINAGDALRFNVDSCESITRLTLIITGTAVQ